MPAPGGVPAGDAGTGTGTGTGAGSGTDGPVAAAPVERPKPLHAPDPYSTPPYGEPGPWAPAPPVQRPVPTPAQGTHLPAGAMTTPAHGTYAPPHPVPTPAHGTHLPASVTSPAAGMPMQAQTHAHAQMGTSTPAQGTHVPYADPESVQGGAPVPPYGGGGGSAAPGDPAAGGGAVPVQGAGAPAGAEPADPTGQWQRYDPWSAPPQGPSGPSGPAGGPPGGSGGKRRRARRVIVVGAVLVALVSGGLGGALGVYLERTGGVDGVELSQAEEKHTKRDPQSVAGIAASALPGVVTLHVSGGSAQGTGTGFVLDAKGHILTNNHVVEPAGTGGDITVTFSGGETAKAEVIGRDAGYDLAVVKVAGVSGLKPLPLGNSDNVRVGDSVVAIGAPFDLSNTVTSGIISAKERPITAGGEKGDGSDISYVDALQTDAPINPGNSGGPLLDSEAHVIGINSAIRGAGGGAEPEGGQAGSIGLGFAIPVNQGKRVAEELINDGKASHPVIGVTLDLDYPGDGARVAEKGNGGGPSVTRGGPGADAGIEPGDVITEVDGTPVHSNEELIIKIRAHRPGDRLDLTVERSGKEREVALELGSSDGLG